MNTIISIETLLPVDVALSIANRVRERRLELNLTQSGLASRAGIKLPTYRKFERSGIISLLGLLNIAFALNSLEDFNALFSQKQYRSIEEVINASSPSRKRGKIND